MSLKAKIEAVIYASEDPVTLAQLAGLLGEEAQAELDAADSAQARLALEGADSEAENADSEAENADSEAENADSQAEGADSEADRPASEADAQAGGDQAATGETTSAAPSPGDELKAAKVRERAVRDHFRTLLDQLTADYANGDRGLEIREVAGGFRLATKPEYHDAVRGFVKSLKPPMKLSLQALETLAVVAYKQPVTSPEVSEIRGVDSGGVLGGLMTRKLVTTAGRKQVIGRPILYKTTKDFLLRFGLKDINELPSIEEFEKMAGELADVEPMQEEIPMENTSAALDERDEAGPQEQAALHDTPEDMLNDKGGPGAVVPGSSAEVEPMRDVHEAQADGVPDEPGAGPADAATEPYTDDDERGA